MFACVLDGHNAGLSSSDVCRALASFGSGHSSFGSGQCAIIYRWSGGIYHATVGSSY